MSSCAALGCKNSPKKGFQMEPFPKNGALRQKWVSAIHRRKFKPSKHSRLCERHFESNMWENIDGTKKLKSTAIPTLFDDLPSKKSKSKKRMRYNDVFSESESDDEESNTDSSDPSFIVSNSEESDSEQPVQTRSAARSRATKIRALKLICKNQDSVDTKVQSQPQQLPLQQQQQRQPQQQQQQQQQQPQQPVIDSPKSSERVYNPYSQIKPIISHPMHPDVRLKRLPFYEPIAELLKPSMLKPQMPQNLIQEDTFSFYLTPQQTKDLINSHILEQNGFCETEKQVQLRFCLAETLCEQQDHFPHSLMVKVNDRQFPIPIHPLNKLNADPKKISSPLNITPIVRLSPTIANTISVLWMFDSGPGYVISVELVKKLSSVDLLKKLKKKGVMHSDHTRGLIKEKLTEEDSEIVTTHLRVSLMCPLGKIRMVHPCRSTTCTHLQCFDSMLYLLMNERKPTWSCPVCDKPAHYENLIIDGYFQDVLQSSNLPSSVNEIELTKDGSWNIQKPISNEPDNVLIDDLIEIINDNQVIETIPSLEMQSTVAQTLSKPTDDVIEILDSDDESTRNNASPVIINLDSGSSSASQSDLDAETTVLPDRVFNSESSSKYPTLMEADAIGENVVTTTISELPCEQKLELFTVDNINKEVPTSNSDLWRVI